MIHIPWSATGSLQGYLTSTITIPTNADIRIVGDGPNSRLYWNGPSGIPMFSLPHPSHATFSTGTDWSTSGNRECRHSRVGSGQFAGPNLLP